MDWEVAPPNQAVVEALLERLVDPSLPRVFANNPSKDAQESVAKQMHAVVLLYNYYLRKQKPDLEFLELVPLCWIAQCIRPSLTVFMKYAIKKEPVGNLTEPHNQLSITEKAINDACNIAESLDASKHVPVTQGLPISKVAVLLIDSKKKKCFLEFGTITGGVWSLIQKETSESSISLDIQAEQKERKKRRTDNEQTSSYDNKLLQIAYEAVKDSTSIASLDLVVLEAHVVHSLSKEKSAAQFFMMQYSQSFNERQSFLLEELVERLQGPLAEKAGFYWRTTQVIDFFHLLPYVGFISSWLLRKDLASTFLNGDDAKSTKNYDTEELPGSKGMSQVEINASGTKSKVANENSENYQNKRKHSSGGKIASPVNVGQSTKERGNVRDEFKDIRDLLLDKKASKTKGSIINFAKPDNNDETHERGYLSDPSRGRSETMVSDNKATERTNVSARTRRSLKAKEIKSLNPKPATCTRRKKTPSPHHELRGSEDGINLMVETAETPKSNDRLCRNEKMTAENGDTNLSCNQNEIAAGGNPLAESEALNNIGLGNATASAPLKNKTAAASLQKSHDGLKRDERITAENSGANIPCNPSGVAAKGNPPSNPEALHARVKNAMLSATEKNVVSLLQIRIQEVCSRIHSMLDELAVYEGASERIMGGGELDLASRCLRNIAAGNDHLLLNEIQGQDNVHCAVEDSRDPQSQTKNRLILLGKSSCQDLEFICLSNNLSLPRYVVLPNDVHPRTTYMATVTVKIKGFIMTSKSDSESSPSEAREACAAQMITRINDTFS